MDLREFDSLFAEMKDYFGDKNFPPKVGGVIFRIVQDLSPGEFSQVIGTLIESSTRAPTPAAVKQAALPLIARARERAQRKKLDDLEKLGERCINCDFTGFIYALKRTSPNHEFAFQCPFCPAAKLRRFQAHKIPIWSDLMSGEYARTSMKTASIEAVIRVQREHRAKLGAGERKIAAISEADILAMLAKARQQPEYED